VVRFIGHTSPRLQVSRESPFVGESGAAWRGDLSFRGCLVQMRETTVNPMRPDSTSSLVVSGIYKYTRNPMYLGFLLVLVGWAIFLSNLAAFALLPAFVVYMNHFQIGPEERALGSLFAQEYQAYHARVRRWI